MSTTWIVRMSVVGLLVTYACLHNHYVLRVRRARDWLSRGALLLDVDSTALFARRSPTGSVNVPLEEFGTRAGDLGDNRRAVVVYAHDWFRGAKAARSLRRHGYGRVMNASGLHTLRKLAPPSHSNATRSEQPTTSGVAMPEHVGQKIQSIADLFAKAERRVGRHQLAIERVTDGVGPPGTAYMLATLLGAWMLANGVAPRFGVTPFDPAPFGSLHLAVCIAALLMTVTILTTQNRVDKLAQNRAQLDLQVNLIAEEKIAKVVALLEELRRDLPSVKDRTDPLAEAMTEAVDLDAVEEVLVGGDLAPRARGGAHEPDGLDRSGRR